MEQTQESSQKKRKQKKLPVATVREMYDRHLKFTRDMLRISGLLGDSK